MSTFWIVVGVVVILCSIGIVYLAVTAPEGYEDDTGFHLGRKDRQ